MRDKHSTWHGTDSNMKLTQSTAPQNQNENKK